MCKDKGFGHDIPTEKTIFDQRDKQAQDMVLITPFFHFHFSYRVTAHTNTLHKGIFSFFSKGYHKHDLIHNTNMTHVCEKK